VSTDWVQGVIRGEIEASVRLREQLLSSDAIHRIEFVCQVLSRSCGNGGKVIVFGNGGSAADAQHLAAEFVGRFRRDRQPLPALALSADIASITAVGNDYAFDHVFERQVVAHGVAGDVAIGLSTSGNSENVLRGIRAARRNGLITVGLSGESGQLREEVDHALCIPATDTARIQEAYMLICHIMCEIVERTLFEPSSMERREHAVLVGRP
jgi:D-sedoheptulose 7-phosphate isomerase